MVFMIPLCGGGSLVLGFFALSFFDSGQKDLELRSLIKHLFAFLSLPVLLLAYPCYPSSFSLLFKFEFPLSFKRLPTVFVYVEFWVVPCLASAWTCPSESLLVFSDCCGHVYGREYVRSCSSSEFGDCFFRWRSRLSGQSSTNHLQLGVWKASSALV